MTTTLIFFIYAAGILTGLLARHILDHCFGSNLLTDFQKQFPGRCPICSYHRYGLLHGFLQPGKPVPEHKGCPEKENTDA